MRSRSSANNGAWPDMHALPKTSSISDVHYSVLIDEKESTDFLLPKIFPAARGCAPPEPASEIAEIIHLADADALVAQDVAAVVTWKKKCSAARR